MKRNDIVIPKNKNGNPDGFYGRVWRRIDATHVQVICGGKYVRIWHEDDLILSNGYKGLVTMKGKFLPMTSLRQLKRRAAIYNAHFGSYRHVWGGRWTKAERKAALASREVYKREAQ